MSINGLPTDEVPQVSNRGMDSLTGVVSQGTIVRTLKLHSKYAPKKFPARLHTRQRSKWPRKASASYSDHNGGTGSGERDGTGRRTRTKVDDVDALENSNRKVPKQQRKPNPVGIIEKEPWLKPFEGELRDRYKTLKDLKDKIEEEDENLLEFARA